MLKSNGGTTFRKKERGSTAKLDDKFMAMYTDRREKSHLSRKGSNIDGTILRITDYITAYLSGKKPRKFCFWRIDVMETYRWSPAGRGWRRGGGGRWPSKGRVVGIRRPQVAGQRGRPGSQGLWASGRRRRAGGDPWRCSRSRSSGLSGSSHPAKTIFNGLIFSGSNSVLSTSQAINDTTLTFGLLNKADPSLDGSDFCFTIGNIKV